MRYAAAKSRQPALVARISSKLAGRMMASVLRTGRMCRILFQLFEREAAKLPHAERIDGSMLLREVDVDDFPDTGPEVHLVSPE
jgi:hypothetical protein